MKVADIGVPQAPSVDKTHGATASLRYDVTPDLQLRSITAWRGVNTDQWDNSGGAHRTIFAPNANFSRYSLSALEQDQFSQEFQAVGSFASVDYVAGFFYFTEHVTEKAATPSSNRWNADGTGYTINSESVIPPVTSGNQGWDPSSWFVQRDSEAKAHSYAAYGQATWTPAGLDMLHLTAGGRYTKDKRRGQLTTVQGKETDFPFTLDYERFDPLLTVAVDAAEGVNLYAKYATGYRAGGANSRSQTFTAFGPESVKSYEAGAKLDLFSHMVQLNLAGYLMDRKGTQTDFDNVDTDPTSPTFNLHTEETRNAPGVSKIRGVEADLTVNPVEGLTLAASYAYTHTKVPPTPNPFLPGNPLTQVFVVYTPENAVSGSVDYELPLSGEDDMRLRFHLDANYADPQYSFQAEPVKTDSSFIVNARVALADIQLNSGTTATLSLWSRNLLDEAHVFRRSAANAAVLGDYGNFNAPRTFGADATIEF
jgi:iron complex outermembrane receptor protein